MSRNVQQKNHNILQLYYPDIYKKLSLSPQDIEREIAAIDKTIYNGEATTRHHKQLEDESSLWKRLIQPLTPPTYNAGGNKAHNSLNLFATMLLDTHTNDLNELTAHSVMAHGGAAVCFGLGLGYYVDDILEKFQCRSLIIVEPNITHIECTAYLHDIETWRAICHSRQGDVYFITLDDAMNTAHYIRTIITDLLFGFYDGSVLFLHLPFQHYLECYIKTNFVIPMASINKGFIEDELRMHIHAYINMNNGHYHLWTNQQHNAIDMPVFIVGSGPSLDDNINYIKQYQHKAIIIGCGSGTHALLRNNITPDFHTEFENGSTTSKSFLYIAKQYDVSSISLISPFTIPPVIMKYFNKKFHYYRDSLSPSILHGRHNIVFNTNPTVSNLGLRFALLTGFKNIVLFGVDMAKKIHSTGHSKFTNYYDKQHQRKNTLSFNEAWFELAERSSTQRQGNFGGVVQAINQLQVGLVYLESMLSNAKEERLGATIFNCSDGLYIQHTRPLLADELDYIFHANISTDKQHILTQLENIYSTHDTLSHDILQNNLSEFHHNMAAYRRNIMNYVNDYVNDTISCADLLIHIQAYHDKFNNISHVHEAICTMFTGSVEGVCSLNLWATRRLPLHKVDTLKPLLLEYITYILLLGDETLQSIINTPIKDSTIHTSLLALRKKHQKKRRRYSIIHG